MWELRPLTPLWASTACYRDSFTYFTAYVLADSADKVDFYKSLRVILLVDSLYAEAIEAVKLWAALLSFSPELIWILAETNSAVKLRNCSQSVNLSTGSE
jgi:hypothetical protein